MKNFLLTCVIIVLLPKALVLNAQDMTNKGNLFVYWGYNRSCYTKSDIHFNGQEYDVTFYGVVAKDRPSPLSINYLNITQLSVPQYNFRMGYYLNNRWSLSFGNDHMKYVVQQRQHTEMSGYIQSSSEPKYNGSYLHKDVILDEDLLIFDHTNGLNVLSLDVNYYQPLLQKRKLKIEATIGLGGCFVVTKSNVKMLNIGQDNRFHLSGYTALGNFGLRTYYGKHFFFTAETKGGYVTLPDVLVNGNEPMRASHNFGYLEYYGAVGYRYALLNKIRKIKQRTK